MLLAHLFGRPAPRRRHYGDAIDSELFSCSTGPDSPVPRDVTYNHGKGFAASVNLSCSDKQIRTALSVFMPRISSHYETLQVPRDAPSEAIRAAYKTMARRHHPDRNGNSVHSHRMMVTLNAAFEVLDDPVKRAEYDAWIAGHENGWTTRFEKFGNVIALWFSDCGDSIQRGFSFFSAKFHGLSLLLFGPTGRDRQRDIHQTDSPWRVPIRVVLLGSWIFFATREHPTPVSHLSAAPEASAYTRPLTAPNGLAWPVTASYLHGYAVDHDDGRSEVVVDNGKNATEAYVKLVSVEVHRVATVRHIYIPAAELYRCTNVRKGTYLLEYQDLATGVVKQSNPFEVVESESGTTVQHTKLRITLNPTPADAP
jgi:hypothetical protein